MPKFFKTIQTPSGRFVSPTTYPYLSSGLNIEMSGLQWDSAWYDSVFYLP